MIIGLGGHVEGASDDPFLVPTAGPLDVPFIAGPVSKDRREDLQVWAALHSLGLNGISLHPLDVQYVEDDPPDRLLVSGDRTWGVELTELTVQDAREELAPIRAFGRQLHQRVMKNAGNYTHLRGRLILLFADPGTGLPKKTETLLSDLEQALMADRGYVGEGLDSSAGLPEKLGESGMYGNHGPFHVVANLSSNADAILISASTQAKVFRSQAIDALGARISVKDRPGNDILVITCGLPDGYGYTCPADSAIFQLLLEAAQEGIDILPQRPAHVQGILIHLWNTPHFIVWGNRDLPWTVPDGF
jgi:hypothetical protein